MPEPLPPSIIPALSPNHAERPTGHAVEYLILHYTGMPTGEGALERLRDDSEAARAAGRVSAHYLIETDGRIFGIVPEDRVAWHAGLSYWRGHEALNSRSIGIELVNPGHEWGYVPFTPPQMEALAVLAKGILARHTGIRAHHVLAHADIAPARKQDPGELFDWAWLAQQGVGHWPASTEAEARTADVLSRDLGAYMAALHQLGYDPNAPDHAVRRAFHQHFDGRGSDEPTARAAARLLALLRDTLP